MTTNSNHEAAEGLDGHFRSLNHNQPADTDDDNDPLGVLTTNTKRAKTLDTALILPGLSRPAGAGEPWTPCRPFGALEDKQVLEGLGRDADPQEPWQTGRQ